VAAIMTAHVLVPAFDEQRPATLSAAVVQALLRDELGFDGMVLSDDLEMRAVSAQFAVPEAAVEAIRAGCDAVLIGGGDPDLQACTVEALVRALECGRISGARFAEAGRRLRLAKQRWLPADRPPLSVRLRELSAVLGSDAHQAVAAEMAAFL
jgi:beta-N-acetylhexosaminidase